MVPISKLAALRFQIVSVILLILASSSAARCNVEDMKMITAEVGWAVTGGKLWWTADRGAHWRNITPKPFANTGSISVQEGFDGQPETFASIFFLDTQRGWVLLCCGERHPDKPRNGLPEFHLAASTDAGRTWSIARVKIPHEAFVALPDPGLPIPLEYTCAVLPALYKFRVHPKTMDGVWRKDFLFRNSVGSGGSSETLGAIRAHVRTREYLCRPKLAESSRTYPGAIYRLDDIFPGIFIPVSTGMCR
jgi:hypothetical protein